MPRPVEHSESQRGYAPAVPDAVFFVGDSITFGWRDEDVGGWPTRLTTALSARHAVTAYNLGVRGDTSSSILVRWQDEVGRRKQAPHSVIVFAFGANDAKLFPDGRPFVAPDATRHNTAAILAAAQREHTVLFVGPAPVDEPVLARVINPSGTQPVPTNRQIGLVSQILAEETERAGVPYLDLSKQLADNAGWIDSLRETDGIHPPARGHDTIAALVGAWRPWTAIFQTGDGS